MDKINFKKIESKWQKEWEKKKAFVVNENAKGKKGKYYVLEMFPYPSGGGLHMGHAFNYSIGDIYSRFKRMNGFNVLYPMGYDSLGLPAENAAIKAGTHPKKYTEAAIKNFIKQQKELGLSYDWNRIIETHSPDYYKWDQWIFLKMLEKGLAYRKKSAVNFCEKCNTVLANEQVHQGKCWRHTDTEVKIKHLEQWFIKITDYCDELLDEVDNLKWPEKIKAMQKNWIGKSYGTEIDFEILNKNKVILVDAINAFVIKEKGIFQEMYKLLEEFPNRKIILTNANDEEKKKFNLGGMPYGFFTLKHNPEKINPYYYKKMLEHFNLNAEDVIYFEHNEDAVKSAKSMGIKTFYYDKEKKDISLLRAFIEDNLKTKWPIFTTRPDTIYGVTFMVVSAQHPKLMELVTPEHKKEVDKFLNKIKSTSEKDAGINELEKEGAFTGSYAINPLTNDKIPVYTGNFVVADYGAGMVMAVPAHDQRDYEFAKKYSIPIKVVIQPRDFELKDKEISEAYTKEGRLVNSQQFNNLNNKEAIEKITEYLEKKNLGRKKIQFKLRDWLVSRQRYWGTPIPVVYCDKCKKNIEKNSLELSFYDQDSFNNLINGSKTIETRALNPEEKNRFFGDVKKGDTLKCINKTDKRVIYLEIVNNKRYSNLNNLFEEKDSLRKIFPNKNITSFSELENCYSFTSDYLDKIRKNGLITWEVKVIQPGVVPVDEKDLPVKLPEKVTFGKGNPLETSKQFVETKCPKCEGKARRETDTMDTFVNSSWYYLRYCDNKNKKEIFNKKKAAYWCPIDQYIGGAEHACMHLIYFRFYTKFLRDIRMLNFSEPATKLFNQGMLHGEDGFVMSKSRGNVVLPEEVSKKYGIDTARLFLVSIASPDKDLIWSDKGIEGSSRFIKRLFEYFENIKSKSFKLGKSSKKLESKLNKTIKEYSEDIENFRYNLAVIKIRELFEMIFEEREISKKDIESALKLLHPICPHITEEFFSILKNKKLLTLEFWPIADESKIDEALLKQDEQIEKLSQDINNILKIIESKEKKSRKVFVYVLPNEKQLYSDNIEKIKKKINLDVKIYAVNDKDRYDPENKSKNSKPGKPGIYIE